MKIVSKLILGIFVCVTFSFAGIITGISVVINNQPITLFEIYKKAKQHNISQRESLDILIRQKLEESQIKRLRISADSFEVDRYIDNLASQNGLNQYQFLSMLKSKNIDLDEHKKEIKIRIKRDKLYQQIFRDRLEAVKESELKKFYNKNSSEFKAAESFNLVVYTSHNSENLKAIHNNPLLLPAGITQENQKVTSDTLNKELKAILNKTEEGKFTQILNIQNTPTMFFIKEKKGLTIIPFEDARDGIHRAISKKQESIAIRDYFEKLKSTATIRVVRPPS